MFSRRTDWKLTPNRFTLAHEEALRQGGPVLDLTISNPTRAGLDYDEAEILSALNDPATLDYDPQPKGLRVAREAVAEYYRDEVDPEWLVLTTSTSEGYSYAFRLLCNAGDDVLVPKPSYPLFELLADLQDVNLVPYPLIYDHGWQIDFPTLQKGITGRTRAIVVVHPNNPTGSYVSAEQRTRLNEICRQANLALIADEVFLNYAIDGCQHESFATNGDALTFTLSGLSKISALPQMKLAWMAVSGPSEEANEAMRRLEVIADTFLSLNAPIQLAAKVLLERRTGIQAQLKQRIERNLSDLDQQLASQKSCTRLEVEGGWYALLRVPVTRSDEELAIELLKNENVLVHPGHFYDFATDGYLVLSLITPERVFSEGITKILRAV